MYVIITDIYLKKIKITEEKKNNFNQYRTQELNLIMKFYEPNCKTIIKFAHMHTNNKCM